MLSFLITMYFNLSCPFFFILLRLTNGAAVRLTGCLVSSPGREQSCELLVDQNDAGEVVVLGECDPEASLLLARFYSSSKVDSINKQSSIFFFCRHTLFKRKR